MAVLSWLLQGPYVLVMPQTSGKMFLITGLVQEQKRSGFMVDLKWTRKYEKSLDPWFVKLHLNLVCKLYAKLSADCFQGRGEWAQTFSEEDGGFL